MNAADPVWADRTLVAVAGLPGGAAATAEQVLEEVAVRFADRFGPTDREFADLAGRPRWHDEVIGALATLRSAGLVTDQDPPALTPPGHEAVEAAQARLAAARDDATQATAAAARPPEADADQSGAAQAGATQADAEPEVEAAEVEHGLVVAGVISAPLRDAGARETLGFSGTDDTPIPVMAELNLQFHAGPAAAFERLERLWARASGRAETPTRVAGRYLAGALTMREIKRLVAADAVPVVWAYRGVHHIWPDFPVRRHIDASCVTVKVDAARNSFEADGRGIVWAVIDSGIDANHPHFAAYGTVSDDSVRGLHRYFPLGGLPTPDGALEDSSGHGTHVAGIIAGDIGPWLAEKKERQVYATESRYNVENPNRPMRAPRAVPAPEQLTGMAPRARLVSLKVLSPGGTLEDRVHRVIQALAYVRETNGDCTDGIRIHGVNLSLGYEFDPDWFACGRSPLCQEVDRLVRSGVVVVVAAGNSGYGSLSVALEAPRKFGLGMTINDPGNAQLAITVGSTHRTSPHTYGVSYFSSKGPTGDGRNKPDLLAPGERITSCAAGENLTAVVSSGEVPADRAVYVEDSGTSMAAPHVSGAVAALLSVRREFIGEPETVKRIFVDSATDLGRSRDFQGAGLIDLMRALQQKI